MNNQYFNPALLSDDERNELISQLEQSSKSNIQEAHDSFERCDTDGFLSQWAHQLTSRLDDLKISILKNGGKYLFNTLVRVSDGKPVRAKLINGRYGLSWAFCDEKGQFTGKFLGCSNKLYSEKGNKGYRVEDVLVDAWAKLEGSNSCTVSPIAYRLDGGFPKDAEGE